jgi:hypothetical protein
MTTEYIDMKHWQETAIAVCPELLLTSGLGEELVFEIRIAEQLLN